MTASILGVRNLGWRAGGTPVLEQVNFAVSPGEFVGVMGRNGAGKSTLLDILAGLKTASKGAVTLKDRPLGDWAPVERARLLAHLPQSLRADLSMRGEALVLMGRYPYASGWFESAEDRDIALEAMTRCGCLEFRHRRLGTLSGGERQRVLLAACLAQQPRVLLLDEPATFLDVDQQLQCFTVLRAEAERGAACLAVTHDVNLALTFCTRLLVLAGRTVACDMPAATALDAPEWLGHFSTRLRVDGGLGMRPWVPVPVTVPAERSAAWWIGLSALSFAAAAVMLPFFGPTTLDLSHVWSRQEPDWSILTNLRLSRTLLGLFAGGALALSGSLFQSMLRDALATPYTLGVSTGASLGAVVAIGLEWHMTAGIAGVWAGAFGGAAIVLYVVMGAATQDRQLSVSGLLLAGIAINSVCGALILLVHGLSGMSQSFAISRWLIGSLDAVEFPTLAMYIGVVILLAVVIIRQARHWNLLSVGEAWAATRGAGVNRSLLVGYIAGSVLAAATVALTGPIGFVGLVVPHLLRARLGGDDRIVMPCAFLLGGMLLAACDALGRVVIAPAEIPAGAITAFIGGPYLIWMIRKGSMR